MFDFNNEILTDRKTKEFLTLQEMLQKESLKYAERESELKKIIEELQSKLKNIGQDIKNEYDKKIKIVSEREELLLKTKADLEIKINSLEHNLTKAEGELKLKEEVFSKIQREKEEQVQTDIKHLTSQIDWLKKKLEEETHSYKEIINQKNDEINQLRSSCESTISSIKSNYDSLIKSLQSQIDEKQKNVFSIEEKFIAVKSELALQKEQTDKLTLQLTEEKEDNKIKLNQLQKRNEEMSNSIKEIENKYLQHLKDKEEEIQNIKKIKNIQIFELECTVTDLRKTIKTLEQNLSLLQKTPQASPNSLPQGERELIENQSADINTPQQYYCPVCSGIVEFGAAACPACGVRFS